MATPNREQHVNLAETALNGSINNSTTTVVVDDGSVFPSVGNFRVMVDSEIMRCTARSSNTLTVVRGQDGTSGASHSDDALIRMIYSKQGIDRLFQDTDALWGYASRPPVHGVYNDAGTGKLVATDFTWVNQGGASRNDNNDSITLRVPTGSGANLRMLSLSQGGNFVYVAGFRGIGGTDGSALQHFGLGMRESGTSKVMTLSWGGSNTNRQRYNLSKWTNSTTLSTHVIDSVAAITARLLWFKVEYDGTNVKFYGSPDGFNWSLLLSETKTTFFTTAPNEVVWFGNNFDNAGTGGAAATELIVSLDHWHKE